MCYGVSMKRLIDLYPPEPVVRLCPHCGAELARFDVLIEQMDGHGNVWNHYHKRHALRGLDVT